MPRGRPPKLMLSLLNEDRVKCEQVASSDEATLPERRAAGILLAANSLGPGVGRIRIIAAEFAVHPRSVRRLIHDAVELGVEAAISNRRRAMRPTTPTLDQFDKETQDEISALYATGAYRVTELAHRFDVPAFALRELLRRNLPEVGPPPRER